MALGDERDSSALMGWYISSGSPPNGAKPNSTGAITRATMPTAASIQRLPIVRSKA